MPLLPSMVLGNSNGALSSDFALQTATISECRYRWLRVRDLSLRRFGPYDRKSRRAQLSIRHGDRNYDRSIAGLGTGKAQRYFASDFDRLSSRLFKANGIAAVSRRCRRGTARVQPVQHCSTGIDKGNYMKVARIVSTS
jgi:hypothetical protein